jgi:hypothetical protein
MVFIHLLVYHLDLSQLCGLVSNGITSYLLVVDQATN